MTAAAFAPARKTSSNPLVRTPSFEEATARLQFLVDQGSRVGLLTGASGSGKTTLLARIAEQLRAEGCLTAHFSAAAIGPEEMLYAIAAGLQAAVEPDWNLFRLRRAVNDRLLELRFLRGQAVVLVDDAGHAGSDLIPHLYRLIHDEAAADARLTLVLATTRESASRLTRPLLELVDLRIDLPAWTVDETRVLIEVTGDRERPIRFAAAAVERVCELTDGVPRRIVRLAEQAKLAAAAEGLDFVDAATVDGVYDELNVLARAG